MRNSRQLDRSLRERLAAECYGVISAMDVALAEPTPAALDELSAATDEVMRAAARVRLELERVRSTVARR
jgi:hypothetical protein